MEKIEFSLVDWQNYRNQILNSIRVNTMAIMSDNQTLDWINSKIKEFEKCQEKKNTSKEEEKSIKSVKN